MRILTFNVQNLRLRRAQGRARLDGARDGDAPGAASGAGAAGRDPLDHADRRLTAAVLARAGADVCVLQEVFDRASLDYFHDHLLRGAGAAPWPWRACRPGNDGAGRDLAVMARRPFAAVSHARLRLAGLAAGEGAADPSERPVFSRDCLRVELGALVLFAVHFKAPYPDAGAGQARRRLEALAVRQLIERRFGDPAAALWLVLGDMNDPREGPDSAVSPLLAPFGVDLTRRMPEADRWTWQGEDGARGCPDAILASPALAARWPEAVPWVIGKPWADGTEGGGGGGAVATRGGPTESAERPHASDHAALVLDLPGL